MPPPTIWDRLQQAAMNATDLRHLKKPQAKVDPHDLDTPAAIARTTSSQRPAPPATRSSDGISDTGIRHDLCPTMIALAEPWLLGGCSHAAIHAVTRRHHPAAEPAKSRTNRHRLTPRAPI